MDFFVLMKRSPTHQCEYNHEECSRSASTSEMSSLELDFSALDRISFGDRGAVAHLFGKTLYCIWVCMRHADDRGVAHGSLWAARLNRWQEEEGTGLNT